MPDNSRGFDHSFRVLAIKSFVISRQSGLMSGLAMLPNETSQTALYSRLQLLVQNNQFQDAADLVSSLPPNCKWIDLAVYAYTALGKSQSAADLIDFASAHCDENWVIERSRVAAAESVFENILGESRYSPSLRTQGLSSNQRQMLEFVTEVLEPIVARVLATGRMKDAIDRIAVEYAVSSFDLLGLHTKTASLVKPMSLSRPVPLVLAQLVLRRVCDPTPGLSARLRTEHPLDFSAQILAALLDRDCYDRPERALSSLIENQPLAEKTGMDAVKQLCQAIFETACSMDAAAIEKSRFTINKCLGLANDYNQYFDSICLLMNGNPLDAKTMLEQNKRESASVWWQILAKCNEALHDFTSASVCWQNACDLMPHPDLLMRFAGLSIQQKRFETALITLEKAVVQSPHDARLLEQLAFTQLRLRKFSVAADVLDKLRLLEPTVVRHSVNLAQCQARIGNPLKALATICSIDALSPDINVIGLKVELLNSLDKPNDSFAELEKVKESFWHNVRFLLLYIDTAYRSGRDDAAFEALRHVIEMQKNGELPEKIFHEMSREDVKQLGVERFQQKHGLLVDIVRCKLPWLIADSLLNVVPLQAWHHRTQPLRWLSEDLATRGEFSIYSTNRFFVKKEESGDSTLSQIQRPSPGEAIVADMSALLTLHKLGRLQQVVNYFGKLILPASIGDLAVNDSKRLTPHQPSREHEFSIVYDLVQRKLIAKVDRTKETSGIQIVDEYYDDEGTHFSLSNFADLIKEAELITTSDFCDLEKLCKRSKKEGFALRIDEDIAISISTLRTLARFSWFEHVMKSIECRVFTDQFERETRELKAYEFQTKIFDDHQVFWGLINRLSSEGKVEFQHPKKITELTSDHDGDESDEAEQRLTFIDGPLVARENNCRLLADDRFCQSIVFNETPENGQAAFGSDLVVESLEQSGVITPDDALSDFLKLIGWRYRFLVLLPSYLKVAADRSKENLPGPELRSIGIYVQQSMKDPGLLCGMEPSTPPMPIAFKYFLSWKANCVEFLGLVWKDESYSIDQLTTISRWCLTSLFPSIPNGLMYTQIGRRLGDFLPRSFLMAAMIRFATIQPIERANCGLRLFADELGVSEDEFFKIAAETAYDRF
jgi:tetratricopeptide (TPR) repeat protein